MSLMLSTKLPSFKSSNPKQIPSQEPRGMSFGALELQEVGPPVLIRVPHLFASEFSFQPTQNAQFQFLFVACQLHDECSTNRSEAGKKHHSSCLCLATKAQRTAMRNFPFYSFVPCLTCPMFFFIIPCFLQASTLVHLFLQKRKRVDELQKSLGHKYNSKFHSNAYLSNFPFSYV